MRGTLAWEVGSVKTKAGTERKIVVLVTNIYEKINGPWLMVTHDAQPNPQ